MARKVYFSFHYQDVIDFRANIVRNSGKFRKKGQDRFRDGSIREEAKEKQVSKIKQLIDASLKGNSVTCVLIGSKTYSRRWVRYEIMKSFELNKGQVGVGINWIKDKYGKTKLWAGENPFDHLKIKINKNGKSIDVFEYKDDRWVPYNDLPSIKNTYFKDIYFNKTIKLSNIYKTYSYEWNNGKANFTTWIEDAAVDVGR